MHYVHNLETDKFNIFTCGKAEWLALLRGTTKRYQTGALVVPDSGMLGDENLFRKREEET